MPEDAKRPIEKTTRPLPVLRALIDAVDRELLQVLARRYAIVAEIAETKRHTGTPIRDLTREREILAARQVGAMRLGLSPELVESLYRLVLWGSRNRQAELKAELPMECPSRTVAVIGGQGAMGRCMVAMFADLGHAVMIADIDTSITPEQAAETADVVVISVPIRKTVEVIRRLGPIVRPDALLLDVTSVKREPLAAMLASTAASVVGLHPLFGPSVHSLQGQRVAVVPGRGDKWYAWACSMLRARGLELIETSAEAHDRAMAIVQVLTHFSTEVLARVLTKLEVDIDETLRFMSPVYLMELIMTGRHFAQSADLYAAIQMANPETGRVTAAFVEAAKEHRAAIDRGDDAAVAALFEDVRRLLGDFTHRALEQSSFLIDRLVERG